MPIRKRPAAGIAGTREGVAIAASLGGHVRNVRVRRHLTLAGVGQRVGISVARLSAIERGEGSGVPLRTWVALGLALGTPLAVAFSRPLDPIQGTADVAHLAIQELLLERAHSVGRTATFELPTRPAVARDPSTCVCETTAITASSSSRSGTTSATSAQRPDRSGESSPRPRPLPPSGAGPRRIPSPARGF